MTTTLDKRNNPFLALSSAVSLKSKVEQQKAQACKQAVEENEKRIDHVQSLIDHYTITKGTVNAADLKRNIEATANLSRSKTQLQDQHSLLENIRESADASSKTWQAKKQSVDQHSEKLAALGLFKSTVVEDQAATDISNADRVRHQDDEPDATNPFKGPSPAA